MSLKLNNYYIGQKTVFHCRYTNDCCEYVAVIQIMAMKENQHYKVRRLHAMACR